MTEFLFQFNRSHDATPWQQKNVNEYSNVIIISTFGVLMLAVIKYKKKLIIKHQK